MLLPTRCPVCRSAGSSPCAACIGRLRRAPVPAPPPGYERCAALLVYEGPARDLVAEVKYRNARDSLGWLTAAMASLVEDEPVDVVTWAPTTAARRRRRGFDHSELLARRVARRLGRPVRRLLVRSSAAPQTGRSRTARWEGARFEPAPGVGRPATGVLVVDDVLTTGATLAAAGRALSGSGAGPLWALVAAATPARSGTGSGQVRPDPFWSSTLPANRSEEAIRWMSP